MKNQSVKLLKLPSYNTKTPAQAQGTSPCQQCGGATKGSNRLFENESKWPYWTPTKISKWLDMIWIFWPHDISSDSWRNIEMSNPPTFLGAFSASGSQGKWYQQADFLQVFVDCKLNQHNDYHGNSDVFTPPLSKISCFLVPHGQSSLRFRPPHSWQLMPWDRIS